MFICNTLNRSPQQLLRITLQKTINNTKNFTTEIFSQQQQTGSPSKGVPIQDRLFAIKRIRNAYPVRYTSAIAHRLAANSTQSTCEIAEALVTQLLVYQSQQLENHPSSSLLVKALQGLTIQATDAGHIQFNFSDSAIAEYLNLLSHALPSNPEPSSLLPGLSFAIPPLQHRIFLLQHTHARCCSLLRLAHQHQFIELNFQSLENQLDRWQIISPTTLPWLTVSLQLRTDHATELQLIVQIMTVLDALADWQSSSLPASALSTSVEKDVMTLLKPAEGLSQAFHEDHRQWQLMGNLRTQGRDRLQANLGLILITQRLLHYLLHDQLGIAAPFVL